MNITSINILMTGAGSPGAPGIIHCLNQDTRVHLTVADADSNATGKYMHDDFIQIPKAEDPVFSETLLNICLKKKISIVMPLVTRELFPFSKNKKLFRDNGIQVLISSEESINIANNKSSCYEYLKNKGIAVPSFFVVHTVEEFIHAAAALGHPKKQLCFKPSVSNGSRGVRIVSDTIDESDLVFNCKPGQLNISYAHALHILSIKPFPELLVSEYLPGDEYSVDCLADHGKVKLIVPRIRKKMINGISVQGEFIKNERIIEYSRSIIEATGVHGNIGLQVKYSERKEPLLLEINPRVQGTIVAALGAGINLPLLAVKQELNLEIPEDELTINWGVRFSRYWKEVFY
ncbi:MAG: ATP-grasp domain-containing protein [Flavisolibacter sp.]